MLFVSIVTCSIAVCDNRGFWFCTNVSVTWASRDKEHTFEWTTACSACLHCEIWDYSPYWKLVRLLDRPDKLKNEMDVFWKVDPRKDFTVYLKRSFYNNCMVSSLDLPCLLTQNILLWALLKSSGSRSPPMLWFTFHICAGIYQVFGFLLLVFVIFNLTKTFSGSSFFFFFLLFFLKKKIIYI